MQTQSTGTTPIQLWNQTAIGSDEGCLFTSWISENKHYGQSPPDRWIGKEHEQDYQGYDC